MLKNPKVEVSCSKCGKTFLKNKYKVNAAIKNKQSLYCSKKCVYTEKSKKMTKPDFHIIWKNPAGWYIKIKGVYTSYISYLWELNYPDFFDNKDKTEYVVYIKNKEARTLYLDRYNKYYTSLSIHDLDCITKKDFLKMLDSDKEKRYKLIAKAHKEKALSDNNLVKELYKEYKKLCSVLAIVEATKTEPSTNIITFDFIEKKEKIENLKKQIKLKKAQILSYERSKSSKYRNLITIPSSLDS